MDKTNGNPGWTLAASVTGRITSSGTGDGRIVSVTGDTSLLSAGTWPGATATSGIASNKAIAWAVVIPAG